LEAAWANAGVAVASAKAPAATAPIKIPAFFKLPAAPEVLNPVLTLKNLQLEKLAFVPEA
jgi:hypothetical protein